MIASLKLKMQLGPLGLERVGLRDIYRIAPRRRWIRKLEVVEARPEFGYFFRARDLKSEYLRYLKTPGCVREHPDA